MRTRDEVYKELKEVLVDMLRIGAEEITLTIKLRSGLGIESLDFLQLIHGLEKKFQIMIPFEELFPRDIYFSKPGYVKDGYLTIKGVNLLKMSLPSISFSHFKDSFPVSLLDDFFTVEMIQGIICHKLSLQGKLQE